MVPAIQPSEILLEVNGKKVYGTAFIHFVKINQQAVSSKPVDYIHELYRKFTEAVLDEQIENEIMQVKPEYRYLLKEYYEGILLFDIMEKEVWNKAAADTRVCGSILILTATGTGQKSGPRQLSIQHHRPKFCIN